MLAGRWWTLALLLSFALALASPLAAAAWRASDAPVRRALLVAVEDYGEQTGWPRLRGPRRDALAMREALAAQGFRAEDVRLLFDEAATRAGILAAFRALVAESGPDDVLLFYFAGHGSSVPDESGDEPDGFDETLVPFDATLPDGSPNDLLDDDLRELIRHANERTRHVVMVFDCCSSGTNVRGANEVVPRYVAPEARGLAGVRPGGATEPAAEESGYLEPGGSYVSLSACRARESAYEVRLGQDGDQPLYAGLFTHHLTAELRAGTALSYEGLLRNVRARIRGERGDQTPVSEGPLARRAIFGAARAIHESAFVIERTAGAERLLAGRMNALAPGAELGVFGNLADAASETGAVGRIRLSKVGASESSFEWIDAAPSPERRVLWAVPEERRVPRPGIAVVAADDELRAALVGRLSADGTLRLAPADGADLVVELAGEPSPEWSVRDAAGTRLPLTAPAIDTDEVAELARRLGVLARALMIRRAVARPDDERLQVETAIERLDEAGRPVATLDPRDAELGLDERFGCRLTNRSDVPVYVSLLCLSPDGQVAVLLGPENEDDTLPAGRSIRTPVYNLDIHPDNRPFYASAGERFRWVVSSRFHDLKGFEQPPCTTPPLRGQGVGGDLPESPVDAGDFWMTVTDEVRVVFGD